MNLMIEREYMFKLSGLNPVLLILFALFGAGLFAFMVMVIRRFVARIRVREDYDEDECP